MQRCICLLLMLGLTNLFETVDNETLSRLNNHAIYHIARSCAIKLGSFLRWKRNNPHFLGSMDKCVFCFRLHDSKLRLSGGEDESYDSDCEDYNNSKEGPHLHIMRILLRFNTTTAKMFAMLESSQQSDAAGYLQEESEDDSQPSINTSRPGRRAIPMRSRATALRATWRSYSADAVRHYAAVLLARASSAARGEARALDAAAIHQVLHPTAPPVPPLLSKLRQHRRHRALEALDDGVTWLDAWYRTAASRSVAAVARLFFPPAGGGGLGAKAVTSPGGRASKRPSPSPSVPGSPAKRRRPPWRAT